MQGSLAEYGESVNDMLFVGKWKMFNCVEYRTDHKLLRTDASFAEPTEYISVHLSKRACFAAGVRGRSGLQGPYSVSILDSQEGRMLRRAADVLGLGRPACL